MTTTISAQLSNNTVVAQIGGVDQKVATPAELPSAVETVTGKMAEAVEQAGLAYEFSPGSYTMSALQACLAAKSALDGVVVMPKEVADAAYVLIADYLWNHYDANVEYLRGRDYDDAAVAIADTLEAAAELYREKWLSTRPDEPDEPDLFGDTGGEETNADQQEGTTT